MLHLSRLLGVFILLIVPFAVSAFGHITTYADPAPHPWDYNFRRTHSRLITPYRALDAASRQARIPFPFKRYPIRQTVPAEFDLTLHCRATSYRHLRFAPRGYSCELR